MATAMGFVEEFQPGPNSSWEQYVERLDFYFIANDIQDPVKKRAVLFSVCGKATYSLIRSVIMPQTPSDLSYKEIVDKMGQHFSPKPSEIVQRFKFNKRNQASSETVSDYVADLRRLSEHCGFGATLDDMLRDRLVCGMWDESVQRRLLSEPNMTFNKALEIAIAAETAQKNALALRPSATTSERSDVNKMATTKKNAKYKPWVGRSGKQPGKQGSESKPCFRCGDPHSPSECRFAASECRYCKKKGHIERVCLSKARQASGSNGTQAKKKPGDGTGLSVNNTGSCASDDNSQTYLLNAVNRGTDNENYTVTVNINGVPHIMEVDSGAACSIISEESFHRLWPMPPNTFTEGLVTLRTWTQQKLPVLGTLTATVEFRGSSNELPLIVVKGAGVSLLGRNWFNDLGITLSGIQNMGETLLRNTVFAEELGCYKGPPVSVEVDPEVKPIFLKSRSVPYALRDKVDTELRRLEAAGVLESISHSDWATPIVTVLKKDGTIRLCGDYRATINKALKMDIYPLPTTAELLSQLAGGKRFTKLDMSEAYLQLPVDDATSRLLTINTPRGLFRVKRLPFGIASAPSIFQRVMDTILPGLPGVGAYLDDVLIAGGSEDQLQEREAETLKRIGDAGLRLRKQKCAFNMDSVEYLGFRVDANGVHPTSEKVQAIHEAPCPTNKQELQAFLGLLNFYSCFLPHKASVLEPLHRLLDAETRWAWSATHVTAFNAAKQLLQSDRFLVHYDPELPLILACDASSYGLGAVLSHGTSEGLEKPISFASRTLTKSERNYSQLQKEALSVIFGVKKFHAYLYGRSFTIVTDHQPLLGLFHPTRAVPQVMSPQMLRWSLLLSAYRYQMEYRPGKRHANADALSRLPLAIQECDIPPLGDILMLESSTEMPIDTKDIGRWTRVDPLLSRVHHWLLHGFPQEKQEQCFEPFLSRRLELSAHRDCLLWGSRVVIPDRGREDVLRLLHNAHPGIVRMKALARSYVWWPGIDKAIEDCVQRCDTCQMSRKNPTRAQATSWVPPGRPWTRLHVDFAGPFHGKTFFLVVDAHSRWLEVFTMKSTTSHAVITKLRELFATHGLPDVVVSDNATVFTSSEYQTFLQSNGISAVYSPPYHPSSNGQIERYVQTTKAALSKLPKYEWEVGLARFLFSQHVTPSAASGISPAELLMGRRLRTALDRLHPDSAGPSPGSSTPHVRTFKVGDAVFARCYHSEDKWVPAKVTERIGLVSYVLRTTAGRIIRRHVDQLIARHATEAESDQLLPRDVATEFPPTVPVDQPDNPSIDAEPPVELRRSTRVRTAPQRYGDFRTHSLGGKELL